MKIPFIVGGAAIVVVVAVVAYVELRPAPVAVVPPPATPPPTASTPTPPAPPAPAADCLLPGPPPVSPDGGKATADDMKLAHDVIQAFVEQLEAYQACRERQIATAAPGVTDQQKQDLRVQGNAAIDEAQGIAATFSGQLKVYHAKHPEPLAQTPSK